MKITLCKALASTTGVLFAALLLFPTHSFAFDSSIFPVTWYPAGGQTAIYTVATSSSAQYGPASDSFFSNPFTESDFTSLTGANPASTTDFYIISCATSDDFSSYEGSVPASLPSDCNMVVNGQLVIYGGQQIGNSATSQILSFSPSNGSTTASTSVTISANFYNGIESYQDIHFHITNIECTPADESCPDATTDIYLPVTITGAGSVSTTTNFADGEHLMSITMEPRTGTDPASTTSLSDFTVVYSNAAAQITYNPAAIFATTSTSTVTSCSDSSGTLIEVLCKVLDPSPQTWQNLYNLGAVLNTKPPLGYFADVQNELLSASTTSTTSSMTGFSIPAGILENFFTPVRNDVGGILWGLYIFWFFRRLSNIHLW